MNPKILNAYVQAEVIRQKQRDYDMWLHNMYTFRAVLTALDKGFNGKKSKLEYPERPFSQEQNSGNEYDPETQNKVKLLFASLDVMASNYNLNKNNKADSV